MGTECLRNGDKKGHSKHEKRHLARRCSEVLYNEPPFRAIKLGLSTVYVTPIEHSYQECPLIQEDNPHRKCTQ